LGKAVSKQALFERIENKASVDFAKRLFVHAMSKSLSAMTGGLLLDRFRRVLLQDSTTLSLPSNLSKAYPGNVSRGEHKAVLRLQCLINIKTMHWLDIALKSFTSNDQSASKLVLPLLKKGDLLIRDLGYFVLDVFTQIQEQQAFYISRLRYGVSLYTVQGELINWKQLCRKKGIIDDLVLAGVKQKLKMRIVMIPLPQQKAAEKIRRAKADRDKRLNHSEDYYRWLGYNVFITNIAEDTLTAKQISDAYKVRWQIEILFKTWKSGLQLQKILHQKCTNLNRVETSIYLTLMLFCLIVQQVYMLYHKPVNSLCGKYLSLIKLCCYVRLNMVHVISLSAHKLKQTLVKYCCYETRKDRINMTELITYKNLA
jgi:Transposase DDE domain